MKQIRSFSLIALLLAVTLLTACGDYGEYMFPSEHEELFVDTVNDLFDALDKGDRGAVSALLAPAVAQQSSIDEQLDALFEFYKGPHTEIEGEDAMYYSKRDGDVGEGRVEMSSSFTVTTEEEVFQVYMEMWSLNEADQDQVGIRLLDFATEEAAGGEDFIHYNTDWGYDPGIYFQTSPERRADVCKINYNYYRYTATPERTLDADDLLQAIEGGAMLSDLKDTLGEPNAQSEEFGYYFYALSDGTFAFCCTQWQDADIDDGVDGDQLGSICLSSEEALLDTLWLRDNVIRVWDNFCLYKPGKTLKDADVFLEQVKADRSTEALYEKFGEPHAYGAGRKFYCLEDGNFIGYWANSSDETIAEVVLVSERDKLAVLWSEDD